MRSLRSRSDRNRPALLLTAALAVVLMSSVAVAADFCAQFNFGILNINDRTRNVGRALARVYSSKVTSTSAQHQGAATVIHLNPLLLVTAGHVTPEDNAKVGFPGIGDDKLYSAKVIARPTKSLATTADVGQGLDFAVLLVERPPTSGVSALEVWLDYLSDEDDHHLAAYGRESPVPLWGSGQLAPIGKCAWQLRQVTFNGDSGGAAVHGTGLLVGIILDGREGGQFKVSSGANGLATILPLTCVRDTIMAALDKVVPVSKTNILDIERNALVQKLRPPATPGWIDNLDFARGLRDVTTNQDLARRLQSRDAITCPLVKSTIERKLGYETAAQLIKFSATNAKAAGDTFKKSGDLHKMNDAALTRRLYASAIDSYDEFVRSRLAVPTFAGKRDTFPADLTHAILARAHTLTALAQIDKDSTVQMAAIGAAVQAVNAASNSEREGAAYAVLGNAAFNARDFQTAIEAYSSASQKGYQAPWVKTSYVEAFRRRDNIVEHSSAKDYVVIGTYPGLDRSKLVTIGGPPLLGN